MVFTELLPIYRNFSERPDVWKEAAEHVVACSVCNQNKTSNRLLVGFLLLPVPQHPWSDISLDFVTGLPSSEGNTAMLTVVD